MATKRNTFTRKNKRHKFGEILLNHGNITQAQLDEALKVQKQNGGFLGDIMLEKGFITETDVVYSLSTQYGLPVLRVNDFKIDEKVVSSFPAELLYVHRVIPFCLVNDILLVLTADLPSDEAIDRLEEGNRTAMFYISFATDVSSALKRLVPVSEDERREFQSKRSKLLAPRKKETVQVKAGKKPEEASPPGESAASEGSADHGETELFDQLDNCWEAIFDEAEENVKKKPS